LLSFFVDGDNVNIIIRFWDRILYCDEETMEMPRKEEGEEEKEA
jgi:hypothetical protein